MIHPALRDYRSGAVDRDHALLFFTNISLILAMKIEQQALTKHEITTINILREMNKSLPLTLVSKRNKLTKKLAKLDDDINDLKERLDIVETYFSTFSEGFIN